MKILVTLTSPPKKSVKAKNSKKATKLDTRSPKQKEAAEQDSVVRGMVEKFIPLLDEKYHDLNHLMSNTILTSFRLKGDIFTVHSLDWAIEYNFKTDKLTFINDKEKKP